MPKKPTGPKRPRDLNALAKLVTDVATGEAEDEALPEPDPAAVKRGAARRDALTPEQRRTIAKGAAAARWGKKKG